MIQNVTYHCPNCKVAITTNRLTKHVHPPTLQTINKVVWNVHGEAYYNGVCYNCGTSLIIDKYGINGEWERPEI